MDGGSPHLGNESPPLRSTILGSFLRGRPRGTSQSHISTQLLGLNRENSPSPPAQSPPSPVSAGHRRRPAAAGGIQTSISHNIPPAQTGVGLGLTQMLRRRRSAGSLVPSGGVSSMSTTVSGTTAVAVARIPSITAPAHRIRLVPHLDSRRSLRFEAICRDLREGDPALRIGRFTDRSGMGLAAVNALGSNKLAFKSKVVSRAHAEIWVELGGKFFIKDTKSSSGTFLNHVRLSAANTESRPHQIKDGDILQLGVDYQGGTEDIYKSVKIRIEVGREWQSAANAFNTNAFKNLKTLAVAPSQSTGAASAKTALKSSIPDCCICLFAVTIRQALFIAPCSHTFHYKCIRPLLESHHPAFSCPLCRTFADLEEDVEVEPEAQPDEQGIDEGDESVGDGGGTEKAPVATPVPVVPAMILERAREAERERDAGAETEVEADGGGLNARGRSSRARVIQHRMRPLADLTEPGDADGDGSAGDDDEEMVDLTHAQAQAQIGSIRGGPGGPLVVLDDDGGVVGDEGHSMVHVRGRVDSSEGEGSASGEGSRGLAVAGEGIDDEAVGGKRKR